MRTLVIALVSLAGLGVGEWRPRAGIQDGETRPTFHGVAIDGLSGLPIAQAHVLVPVERQTFEPHELAKLELEAEAWSDDQGRFVLEGAGGSLPTFAYLVAEGHGPVGFLAGEGHSSPERAQPIELLPHAGIEIRVRDAVGAPIAGHPVGVSMSEEELFSGFSGRHHYGIAWRGVTDETGNALFRELPAEVALQWSVHVDNDVRDPGRMRPMPILGERLALAPGELRRIESVLGGGARLVGRVTDEHGAAVFGLELFLRASWWGMRELDEGARRTTSDERGSFEFSDLPFRAFELDLASRGGAFVSQNRAVLVDRPLIELDLTVMRGLAIEGRVRATEAELDMLQRVSATPLDDGDGGGTELGSDGRFRIAPLAPGEYRVFAGGIKLRTQSRQVRAGESGVELALAGEQRIPVILEGADEEKVTFSVHDRADDSGAGSEGLGPRFEWSFRAGRHDLKAWTEDGRVGFLSDVAIDAEGPAELRLVLVPGARVTFVHRAPNGTRTLRLAVAGGSFPPDMMDGSALLGGEACTLLVPAGELMAELLEGGRVVASERASLLPGERRRILLVPR